MQLYHAKSYETVYLIYLTTDILAHPCSLLLYSEYLETRGSLESQGLMNIKKNGIIKFVGKCMEMKKVF